jgi:hypothetical protein
MDTKLTVPSLTERGWRVLVTGLVLATLGAFFRDALLLVASLFSTLVLVYCYLTIRSDSHRVAEGIVFTPNEFEGKMPAGTLFEEEFMVHARSHFEQPITLVSDLKELRFGETVLKNENSRNKVLFRAPLSGTYSSESIKLELKSLFGLLSNEVKLPFKFTFRVYPKVVEAAMEAARFIAGEDIYVIGEEPTRFIGSGYEYADTRQYIPGDSLRRLDWKATARLNRYMVKDYYAEGGVNVHIVYDGSAPDPVSRDDLAAAFVKTTLSLARRGLRIDLTIVAKDGVSEYSNLPGFEAAAIAVNAGLGSGEGNFVIFYGLLDPQTASRARTAINNVKNNDSLIQFNSEQGPLQSVSLGSEEKKMILYVSSLVKDPLEVLSASKIYGAKGWSMIVLQPTKPWNYASDLSASKDIWDSYAKIYRVFDRESVRVVSKVEEMAMETQYLTNLLI